MAKLWPLLTHCKFFMKCIFVLSLCNAYAKDFSVHHYVGFLQIKAKILFICITYHVLRHILW